MGVNEGSLQVIDRGGDGKLTNSITLRYMVVSHVQRIGCQPEKNYQVLYTVANPARGLLTVPGTISIIIGVLYCTVLYCTILYYSILVSC